MAIERLPVGNNFTTSDILHTIGNEIASQEITGLHELLEQLHVQRKVGYGVFFAFQQLGTLVAHAIDVAERAAHQHLIVTILTHVHQAAQTELRLQTVLQSVASQLLQQDVNLLMVLRQHLGITELETRHLHLALVITRQTVAG